MVMAAGLAGGIGLSGGACGALCAAIWINGMKSIINGDGQLEFKSPEAMETIDKFIQNSDFEFECAKITGRTFENADYLKNGGCAKIIEVLAAE